MSEEVRTVLICDKCRAEFIGHTTVKGTPQKVKARLNAIDAGWYIEAPADRRSGERVILCPKHNKGDQ